MSSPSTPPKEEPNVKMTEKKKENSSTVPTIALILSALFGLGSYTFLVDKEPNKCGMSYMYELPQYIKLSQPEHYKYSLFAYGEGQLSEPLRKGQFSGVPVLFIPGNAGSFRQVRSLASVALRKAIEETKYKTHFDYFSADFGEEYSALFGGTLEEQAGFVRDSVKAILKLYKEQRHTSVILIGHSVGGLIAKALFNEDSFDPKLVKTIITLATPHTMPVVNTDPYIDNFYRSIDTFWNASRSSKALDHILLVSIGGGIKDIQVRPGLTWSAYADINIQTTAASGIWVSADHRCIVWCKQLVLALNRALFDLIEEKDKTHTVDKTKRLEVFKYHLVQRTAGKRYHRKLHPEEFSQFDTDGDWKDIGLRQYTFKPESPLKKNTYIMIKTLDDPKHQKLTVDAVNMDNDDWIFACKSLSVHKPTIQCDQGVNLSNQSVIMPSNGKRKSVTIDLVPLRRDFSHVVVYMKKGLKGLRVTTDVYSDKERTIPVHLPRWISFVKETRVVPLTVKNGLFYNLSLQGMEEPWQAYELSAFPLSCQVSTTTEEYNHFGLLRAFEETYDTYQLLGANMSNSIVARVNRPKAVIQGTNDPQAKLRSEVHLYLDPECRYAISIRPHLGEMFAQMVRFYYFMILPMITSIVLYLIGHQIKVLDLEGRIPSCLSILWGQVSPLSVLFPARMVSSLVVYISFFPIIDDLTLLKNLNMEFALVTAVMYFVSLGICIVWVYLSFLGIMALAKVFNKFLSKVFPENFIAEILVDSMINQLSKFPKALAGVLIVIGWCTCGTITLSIGSFCHFLKMSKIYKNYLEWLVKKSMGLQTDFNPEVVQNLQFHLSLSFLWTIATILNLSSFLAWTNGVTSSSSLMSLSHDQSYLTAFLFSLSIPIFWSQNQPSKFKLHYSPLSLFIKMCAILVIAFGLHTAYRINYVLNMAMIVLSLHQYLAPEDPTKEFQSETDHAENEAIASEKKEQ